MPVSDQSRPSSPLRAAAAAVAFLTRAPVGRLVAFDGGDVARGAPFYPLVGAGVGALVGLTTSQLQRPLTAAIAAGLALLVGALVTGALHLDALADCADALGAHSRKQALRIMRDHAIGTYGTTALALDLLIKGAALAALAQAGHVVIAAAAAGALARGAPVALASALPYARTQGTAGAIIEQGSRVGAVTSALIAIALASALLGSEGIVAVLILVGVAAAVTTASGLACHRSLGGVSGDTLGATTEVVETLLLVGRSLLSESVRLLLIRHAQPEAEAQGRCCGSLDVGLSARGERLARHLARVLDGIPLAAVYTSPRSRATLTAAPLAAINGLAPTIVEALGELDFGDFEGRRYEDISREHPELFAAWMSAPTTIQFPGGESFADLRSRVLAATATIRHGHPDEVVAIISHGGVIRAVLADTLNMPTEAIFRLEQSYGGISIIDWLDGTPIVRLVNGQATMVGHRRRGFLPGLGQLSVG